MNVTFNSLAMGLDTHYHIEKSVTGLEKAPIRTTTSNFAGKDGGYVSAQFFGARPIVFKGQVISASESAHETERKALEDACAINQLLDLEITMPSGNEFFTQVYVRKLDFDYGHPTASAFKLELIAPDHEMYAGDGGTVTAGAGITVSSSGLIGHTVDKLDTNGFILPVILPVTSAAEGYTTVVNDGDLEAHPVIRLNGIYHKPRVYNITKSSVIEVDVTTNSGDEILIDMKAKTMTLNGVNILPYKTSFGDWWSLQTGNNDLYLETDSGSDNTTCIVEYRHAYSGI